MNYLYMKKCTLSLFYYQYHQPQSDVKPSFSIDWILWIRFTWCIMNFGIFLSDVDRNWNSLWWNIKNKEISFSEILKKKERKRKEREANAIHSYANCVHFLNLEIFCLCTMMAMFSEILKNITSIIFLQRKEKIGNAINYYRNKRNCMKLDEKIVIFFSIKFFTFIKEKIKN